MKLGIPRPLARHPHEMASGLASLGRQGDSTLVHMSPAEVGGLQKLAQAHGGSLTTNPQTGLPEASFLSNILPLVGGALLGEFGGADVANWLPELSVGAGLIDKAAGGSWTDAITKGLQFYGGASAAESLNAMGNAPTPTAVQQAAITPTAASTTPMSTESMDTSIPQLSSLVGGNGINALPVNVSGIDSFTSSPMGTPAALGSGTIDTNLGQSSTNATPTAATTPAAPKSALQQFESSPSAAAKTFFTGLGASPLSRQLALAGIASGIGSALQPSSSTSGTPQNVQIGRAHV